MVKEILPQARVFKYGPQAYRLAGVLFTLALILMFFGLTAVKRGEFDLSFFLFFWPVTIGYLIIVILFVFNQTDLVLSDEGVFCRRLGKIFKRTAWYDIDVVREFSLSSQSNNKKLILHIIPKISSPFRFRLIGKIIVDEDIVDFDVLLKIINEYIQMHKIKVEVKINNSWELRNQLITSAEFL